MKTLSLVKPRAKAAEWMVDRQDRDQMFGPNTSGAVAGEIGRPDRERDVELTRTQLRDCLPPVSSAISRSTLG